MDLFSRLAHQQRELTPALKPVLPPRFATRDPLEAPSSDDAHPAAFVATRTPFTANPDTEPGAHRAEPPQGQTEPLHDAEAPVVAKLAAQAVATQGAVSHPPAERTSRPAHSIAPQLPTPPPRAGGESNRTNPLAVASAALRQQAVPSTAPDAPTHPPLSHALPFSAARAQLLSPQPAPAASAPQAPAVVHVHIDRIDVRAPAAPAPRPAPARPARTAAQHTLADYLRGGGAKP